MRLFFTFCFVLFFSLNIFGQEVNLTQIHSAASVVNPALTGISANPRLFLSYRDQWMGSYIAAFAGYDQRISPKAGCIGAYVSTIDKGRGFIKENAAAMQYAYHFKVDDDVSFRLGINAGVFQKFLDTRGVNVSYGIEPRLDITDSTRRVLKTEPTFSIGAGGVFIYRNFFAGAALQNINSPKYNYFKSGGIMYPKYIVHAGAFIPLQQTEKPFILAPYAFFEHRPATSAGVITAGANVNKGIFTGGASITNALTNAVSINFLVAATIKRFRVGYTYEYPSRERLRAYGVSHELTMAFYFGKPRQGTATGLPHYFRQCAF